MSKVNGRRTGQQQRRLLLRKNVKDKVEKEEQTAEPAIPETPIILARTENVLPQHAERSLELKVIFFSKK